MFKVTHKLLTYSFFVSWSLGVSIQAYGSPLTLPPDDHTFYEKYDETVDVAGQLRAGLMFRSSLKNVDIDNLRLDLRLQEVVEGEKACIRVASRNGVFSATWEITLDTDVPAQVLTDFPTDHKKVLEKFHPDELVAIASVAALGESCAATRQRYLLTSWGEPNYETIIAYLNSDSTDAVIAGRINKDTKKGNCRILPGSEESTSFDTICTLPMNLADFGNESSKSANIELIVVRKNFSTVMKKIRYQLSGS